MAFVRLPLRRISFACAVALLATLSLPARAPAQDEFGRNKVRYQRFDFKVLKTEHFDVYFYPREEQSAERAARMAERWYARLAAVLGHELSGRQPLILYASHPDFEQTNAISGALGEGTGGVTEAFKRRIVLPLAGPLAETDHVIGHELVHAFQYDMTGQGRSGASGGAPGALRLPLWFIEGMAEYLSLGPRDPHTAMWMRDAALANDLPSIARLDDPRYFPYRYGQALWAYVAGRWGDRAIGDVLRNAGRSGDVQRAFVGALGVTTDSLTRMWHGATRSWYAGLAPGTEAPSRAARVLVAARGPGDLTLGPALSPDGSQVMFLSERSLFSIDMYLADARTGRVERQITHTAVDPHYQSLEFVNASGAFSPDGRRFAFPAVSKGRPLLSILDIASGRVVRELRCDGLGEVFTPTWSPDGRQIAFSALEGGTTDLWVLEVASGAKRRLTHDAFAELQPAWSPDGARIAFVTDQFDTDLDALRYGEYRLGVIDAEGGTPRLVSGLPRGKAIDPQWSGDGRALYFIGDPDGIANLYRIDVGAGTLAQLTTLSTGASGLTRLSPALSVSRDGRTLVFSAYERGRYALHVLQGDSALAGVAPRPEGGADAALLPPTERVPNARGAAAADVGQALPAPGSFRTDRYRPHLSLDTIGQPSLGVGVGSGRVGIGGGAGFYWSDMLGNHNLATLVQFQNAGGNPANNLAAAVGYTNSASRWDWGLQVSQIPYVTLGFSQDEGTVNGTPAVREQDFRFWQIDREAAALVAYPFSSVQRLELRAGYSNIDFASEVETRIFDAATGEQLSDDTTPLAGDSLPSLDLATAGGALVYDSSVFGGTSPVLGQRARLEYDGTVGDLRFGSVLADVRRYVGLGRSLTLAGRALHYGRYGRDANATILNPLYLGDPWILRGYDANSFSVDEEATFERLLGSRLAAANVELRLALLGALGVIPSRGFPPVELATFYDAGVAWSGTQRPRIVGGDIPGVSSYGAALRVNLLGFAVGEVDLTHPNDRPGSGWRWSFALQPGF